MSSLRIRWEKDALQDLIALRQYIQKENPVAAQKTGRRVIKNAEFLLDNPFLGTPGRIHKTRELVVSKTPYTIIYHPTEDVISILRVFHQAQEWPEKV